MAQHRAITITIHIPGDETLGDEPDVQESAESLPVGRRALALPEGFEDIRTGLIRRGEGSRYSREHASRIWNDAHPEEPVTSEFDHTGGFWPDKADVELPKTKVQRKPAPKEKKKK